MMSVRDVRPCTDWCFYWVYSLSKNQLMRCRSYHANVAEKFKKDITRYIKYQITRQNAYADWMPIHDYVVLDANLWSKSTDDVDWKYWDPHISAGSEFI